MVMSEKEKKILAIKLENPSAKVKCPRCGKEVIYKKIGNSEAAECIDPKCIYLAIRGL